MAMAPGTVKRGMRVKHDDLGTKGVVLVVFDRRGDHGIPVEYATVRFDRVGLKSAYEKDHPTILLSRA